MNPVQISHNLASVLETALPRILTQACRDTGNPAYGCFDRNWCTTGSVIRLIILQQAATPSTLPQGLQPAPRPRRLRQQDCRRFMPFLEHTRHSPWRIRGILPLGAGLPSPCLQHPRRCQACRGGRRPRTGRSQRPRNRRTATRQSIRIQGRQPANRRTGRPRLGEEDRPCACLRRDFRHTKEEIPSPSD